MSVDSLQQQEFLFPHKLKYVGLAISLLCVLYALVHHFVEANIIFEGLHIPAMLFIGGLLIAIVSKEPTEDERIRQIRSYVHTILSGFFIGFIYYQEIAGGVDSMTAELSGFLTVYLLIFYFIKRYDGDWILNNRVKCLIFMIVILVVLLISFDLLWAA